MTLQKYESLDCKVVGCDRSRRSRGWCDAHYNQWRTTGVEPTRPFTDSARFYQYVEKRGEDECWLWMARIQDNGYGKFSIGGSATAAHRASYAFSKGEIGPGLVVRHTCDNKRCVNPNHLILGTPKDNARDAVERGLYRRGEDQARAKLTLEQVVEIRDIARGSTESHKSIGLRFGVSKAQVRRIVVGESWAGLGVNA